MKRGDSEIKGLIKVGTTNQGDILYDNGTSIVRLTPGTSGKVLTSGGAAANPTWEAAAPAAGCAFLAYSTGFSISGTPGTVQTITFQSESFDLGSDYNTGTYRFTAPAN